VIQTPRRRLWRKPPPPPHALKRAARKKPLAIFCLAALLASCENPIIQGWFEEESVQTNIVEKDVPPTVAAPPASVAPSTTGVLLTLLNPVETGEYRAALYEGDLTAETFASASTGRPAFISEAFTVENSTAFITIIDKDGDAAAPDPAKTYALLIKDKDGACKGYFNKVGFAPAGANMASSVQWPDMWRTFETAEDFKAFMQGLDASVYDNYKRPYSVALSGISTEDLGTTGDCHLYDLLKGAFTYNFDFRGCGGESFTAEEGNGSNAYTIREVYLPEDLKKIGKYAFRNCANLVTIKFPSSLETIGSEAFQGCANLTSVDFTGLTALETIGNSAFSNCSTLREVDFSGLTALKTTGENAFQSCANLESVDFSNCDKLATIGNYAFASCANLESVDFSNCGKLATIGNYAFDFCLKLEGVDFSGCTDLETIGNYAFADCSNLTSLDFFSVCKGSLKTIGNHAFVYCRNLESVDFSDFTALATIENYAFDFCSNLERVNFSNCDKLATIGQGAFSDCDNLESVDFTDCKVLATIGWIAFYYCRNLESVDFSGCEVLAKSGIDADAFRGTFLEGRISSLTDEERRDHLTP
jgi:hypothetical protein